MIEKNEMPLIFSHVAAQGKPRHMKAEIAGCPFCDYAEKENILAKEGEFLWIKNKYPTLNDTSQTLIIESKAHNSDISTYTKEENRHLIQFALKCWKQMKNDSRYQSVLFYKNHGPLSGGSLKHPHMQIVGLENLDGESQIQKETFEGVLVLEYKNISVTLSKYPTMGFLEINLLAERDENTELFADYLQQLVCYVLQRYFQGRCDSFNLFFFEREGKLIAKVVPRFIDSPYFVGYRLSQTFSDDHLSKLGGELKAFLTLNETEKNPMN
ncbi:DUF4931 domain-containing protein [Enterococcus sp. AZ196]|uniref:DUF4931 domain-containing protein n=1 Tax=Enterococcus sp. AZ196 TaxID=2774659 RepID=UPI003D28716C